MTETSEMKKRFRIVPVGHSLSFFLLISYLLCVAFGLIAPEPMRMYEAWAPLLPGFEWLTVQGFFFRVDRCLSLRLVHRPRFRAPMQLFSCKKLKKTRDHIG